MGLCMWKFELCCEQDTFLCHLRLGNIALLKKNRPIDNKLFKYIETQKLLWISPRSYLFTKKRSYLFTYYSFRIPIYSSLFVRYVLIFISP